MPVYSMTGFAGVQQTGPLESLGAGRTATRLALEIRSVNSRFLDLSFKLADELRQQEGALRELLQGKLKRGKVEVRAHLERSTSSGPREPTSAQLQRLNHLQDAVLAWLPKAPPLSVAEVLRLTAEDPGTQSDHGPTLLQLGQQALEALMQSRASEGARLARALLDRCDGIEALAQRLEPLVPQLVAQSRQKFLDRFQEAIASTTSGAPGTDTVPAQQVQDRALTEATAFAIRIDVAEELSRLQSHLAEIRIQLAKGGEVGKRLEFLIQELHREANTLGSKSAALELTRIAVDMKVLIEQMREQIQNIE